MEESNDISVLFSREVLFEWEIFKQGKAEDFHVALDEFMSSQIEFFQSSIENYEGLITSLSAFEVEE